MKTPKVKSHCLEKQVLLQLGVFILLLLSVSNITFAQPRYESSMDVLTYNGWYLEGFRYINKDSFTQNNPYLIFKSDSSVYEISYHQCPVQIKMGKLKNETIYFKDSGSTYKIRLDSIANRKTQLVITDLNNPKKTYRFRQQAIFNNQRGINLEDAQKDQKLTKSLIGKWIVSKTNSSLDWLSHCSTIKPQDTLEFLPNWKIRYYQKGSSESCLMESDQETIQWLVLFQKLSTIFYTKGAIDDEFEYLNIKKLNTNKLILLPGYPPDQEIIHLKKVK